MLYFMYTVGIYTVYILYIYLMLYFMCEACHEVGWGKAHPGQPPCRPGQLLPLELPEALVQGRAQGTEQALWGEMQ